MVERKSCTFLSHPLVARYRATTLCNERAGIAKLHKYFWHDMTLGPVVRHLKHPPEEGPRLDQCISCDPTERLIDRIPFSSLARRRNPSRRC